MSNIPMSELHIDSKTYNEHTECTTNELPKGDRELAPFSTAASLSEEDFALAEKRLKRKLDSRLLCTLFVIFVMNYLDRNNIAAAKVAGIDKSLNLTSSEYATCVSILFVGYILFQVPSNLLISHVRPSWYLCSCMAVWGVISALTGVVNSFAGLLMCRFFIGVIEAVFYPGALFMLSSWYKRDELGKRAAFFFGATQIGSAFSGLIGAGITASLNNVRGLESWRWIFIIEGSITVAIALIAILLLPDYPASTRWLSPLEREIAQLRLMRDIGQADVDNEHWTVGARLAFKDLRLYLFALTFLMIQCIGAVSNFFPSVVKTLGFNNTDTLLLTAPPYIISFVMNFLNNVMADKFRGASLFIAWPVIMALAGYVIAVATLNVPARYVAFVMMTAGGHGANAVLLAWTQKTLVRPRTKRAASVSFVNAFGNVASIFTAYLYFDASAPRYIPAFAANIAFAITCLLLVLIMRLWLTRTNHRLADGSLDIADAMKAGKVQVVEGQTEAEQREIAKNFRYII